jgi:hypothetical protein
MKLGNKIDAEYKPQIGILIPVRKTVRKCASNFIYGKVDFNVWGDVWVELNLIDRIKNVFRERK